MGMVSCTFVCPCTLLRSRCTVIVYIKLSGTLEHGAPVLFTPSVVAHHYTKIRAMAAKVAQLLLCSLLLVALEVHGGGDLPLAGNTDDVEMPHWLAPGDALMLTSRMEEDGIVVDAVVSPDGSGDYTTIGAAIDAAPRSSNKRYIVHIKRGLYTEYLNVSSDIWNLVLVVDGMDATVITGNRSVKGGYETIDTATVRKYQLA